MLTVVGGIRTQFSWIDSRRITLMLFLDGNRTRTSRMKVGRTAIMLHAVNAKTLQGRLIWIY